MALFGSRIQIFGFCLADRSKETVYVDTILPHYDDNRKLKGQITESID